MKEKHQFIVTYNIYKNGLIAGSGQILRLSNRWFLDKELFDEILDAIKIASKDGTPADFSITRIIKR